MNLNHKVFEEIKRAGSKILVVTKYWDKESTQDILNQCETKYSDIFYGIGENRIEHIKEKNINPKKVHFIGNIQSNKIPDIIKYCSTIHSLEKLKHAQIINEKLEALNQKIDVFLQVQLDTSKPLGISPNDFEYFTKEIKKLKNINIRGLSGMGKGECSETEKIAEFKLLFRLRDTYLPKKSISAGTSRDYQIGLKQGNLICRIGQNIISS